MLVSDTRSLFVIALSDEPSQSLLSHLPTAFRFLTDATAPNTKNSCFVHCYFGRSRSVAVVLAFLMYDARFRWTLKQSLDYMQTLKPFAVVLCSSSRFSIDCCPLSAHSRSSCHDRSNVSLVSPCREQMWSLAHARRESRVFRQRNETNHLLWSPSSRN